MDPSSSPRNYFIWGILVVLPENILYRGCKKGFLIHSLRTLSYTLSIPYLYLIYTLSIPYLYLIYTLSIPYLYLIYTLSYTLSIPYLTPLYNEK